MTAKKSQDSVGEAERTVIIERVIDAPARLLFEAYAKPEHISKWFGPPGYPLTMCEMDFRVGGKFRFAMTGPDGKQHTPFGGTYHEIVPAKRIKYDNGFEGAFAGLKSHAERMVVTVTFDEQKDGKTKLTISTLFGSLAMMKEHLDMGYEQGTGAGVTQLSDVAKALADRSFVLTRVIDAPAKLLFETYSQPEHLKKWYGPAGYPLTKADLDFRVGGTYRFQMTGPDGVPGPLFGGKYLEITRFTRIVYDDAFEQEGAETLVFVVDFVEEGKKTTLMQTVFFANGDDKKKYVDMGMVQGCNMALDQLRDLANGLAK